MITKIALSILSLCLFCMVLGLSIKNKQYYNAACRMSDVIRCYQDHINDEESPVEDYGCLEELCGIYLWDDAVGDPIDLKDYVFSY